MSDLTRTMATIASLSQTAMEEASRQGRQHADLEHVLLAVLLSPGPGGQALRELGLTLPGARRAIDELHQAQLAHLGIHTPLPPAGRITHRPTEPVELTERAWAALGRTGELSSGSGSNHNSGPSSASGSGPSSDSLSDSVSDSVSDPSGGHSTTAVLRESMAEPSGLVSDLIRRLNLSPTAVLGALADPHPEGPGSSSRRTAPSTPAAEPPPGSGSPDQDSCQHRLFLPTSPAPVWAYLVQADHLPSWVYGADLTTDLTADLTAAPTLKAPTLQTLTEAPSTPGGPATPAATAEDRDPARLPADAAGAPGVGSTWTLPVTKTARSSKLTSRDEPVPARYCQVQLVAAAPEALVTWRVSDPSIRNGSPFTINVRLREVTGGTEVDLSQAWLRLDPRSRYRWLARVLPLAPVRRTLARGGLYAMGLRLSRHFRG